MRGARGLLAALLCAASGAALAHAHLTASEPQADAHVRAPPRLVLTFTEPAHLTQLSIERTGNPAQSLALPDATSATLEVLLPTLAPGDYVVHFRVLGHDGHVVPGRLAFTVVP
ncbi:MAG: copper resistance protein CopC [Proteobacteria bacterium]|nr:copper resistance protein CopC [Pseudomonadota bacterium]